MRDQFVIAFYEIDRAYGGPEEGGWWYDRGEHVRILRVTRTKEAAYRVSQRANRLLRHLQRYATYTGTRCEARVFKGWAPEYFPAQRPHYE